MVSAADGARRGSAASLDPHSDSVPDRSTSDSISDSVVDSSIAVDVQALRSLGAFVPDGLVISDASGTVVQVNDRAGAILDLAGDELLGRDIREVLPLRDRTGTDYWSALDPWNGLAVRTGHRERLLLLPNGLEALVSAKYVRRGRGGPVSAVVLSLRDASSRRRLEATNSVLLSTVAHELRSPLTSVKGFSSTLLRRWDQLDDGQKHWMIEAIEADADRVARLITDLLDISRLDSGRLHVRSRTVDLDTRIRAHVHSRRASGEHADDKFAVEIAPGLPPVWADPDRVDQILANLTENALRHGAGTIRYHAAPDGPDRVAVTVSDEGEGIAEKQYALVFNRFWQSAHQGGTGLGLYIVRGLVEAQGGQIEVGPAPSGGAQFRFTLPTGVPEHLT